jgi:DNA topoisomerase IA
MNSNPITPTIERKTIDKHGRRMTVPAGLLIHSIKTMIESSYNKLFWNFVADARFYKYIAQHFLATLMRPCRYCTKSVKFSIGDEEFVVHSNVILDPGFTQILTKMAVYEDNETKAMLDSLQMGQKLPIKYDTITIFKLHN